MSGARVLAGPVAIDPLDQREVLERLEGLVRDGAGHYVCFCEANLIARCLDDPRLAEVLRRADLALPDGTSTARLAGLRASNHVERVPGPVFMLAALRHGLPLGWRHYFLGGAEGTTAALVDVVRARFPRLEVAGWASPSFGSWTDVEQREIVDAIERSRPDLVWVALGSPRQEFWMAEHAGRLSAPVFLGVGAAFDFHTGVQRWAPRWVRAAGLEWLFRTLFGGPRVLARNLRCVPRVGLLLVREWLRLRLPGAQSRRELAPNRAGELPREVQGPDEP